MEHRSGRGRLSGLAALLGLAAAAPSAPPPSLVELKRAPARKPSARPSKWKFHHSTTGKRRGSKDEQLQRQVDAQAKRLRKGARRLRDRAGFANWTSVGGRST